MMVVSSRGQCIVRRRPDGSYSPAFRQEPAKSSEAPSGISSARPGRSSRSHADFTEQTTPDIASDVCTGAT
jgi:hypothetical protein